MAANSNNFFGNLSNAMANTRGQQFRNQMVGQEFNLQMDTKAREFYGKKANVVFMDAQEDLDTLFNADEKLQFDLYGGSDGSGRRPGEQSFSGTELRAIAGRKWDTTSDLQSQTTKDDYVNTYLTRYIDDSGFSAAAAGSNKKMGQLGYNAETNSYSPTVITYDPERRQVYEADFTFGGQKVSLGGEPQEIPAHALDESLRSYTKNIRDAAGFGNEGAGLAALMGGKKPSVLDSLGGPGSFDPMNDINIRKQLDEQFGATPGAELPTTPTTTTEAPLTTTSEQDTEAPVTTLTQARENGQWNVRAGREHDNEELQSFLRGGRAGLSRWDKQFGGDNYIHENGTIPYNLSTTQWNELQPRQQTMLLERAKTLTHRNISAGFEQGLADQEIWKITEELGKTHTFGTDGPSAAGMSVPKFTTGYNVEMWEEKSGEVIPIEGMDKLQTLKAVGEFYKNNKGSVEDELTDGKVSDITMHDLLRRHPTYYAQFKELGAVEFAKQYMNDPEFAKNLPPRKKQTETKLLANNLEKELKSSLDITFPLINNQEGHMTTRFKEMLDFPKPPGTALENTVVALINDVADGNINEADLSYWSKKQRFVLGYTILGSLPEDTREKMRPNVDALIEYGVLKTRLDRTPNQTQAASAVNTAYSTDAARRRDDITQRDQIFQSETNQANREVNRTTQALQYRTQNIDIWKELNTTRKNILTRRDKITNDANDLLEKTQARLDKARTPGTSDDPKGEYDAFTAARALRGNELKRFTRDKDFKIGLNVLMSQVAKSKTTQDAVALAPIIDNAIYAIVAGDAVSEVKWWKPLGKNSWADGITEWARGSVNEATGDLSSRLIAIGTDGAPITDMSQAYHPTRNTEGTKVQEFRAIAADGSTQQGISISPGKILAGRGQELYELILNHAVYTATMYDKGG
jgi:hypothetical protein